jgi:hypothetical protein
VALPVKLMGDMVISLDTAASQAAERRCALHGPYLIHVRFTSMSAMRSLAHSATVSVGKTARRDAQLPALLRAG